MKARAFPLSDAQPYRPTAATSGRGLLHQGRMQIKKQAQRRRRRERVIRVGTLNVGSMTGRGREVADMMKRRRVDILCVQETRWKGEKARELGDGYKLYFSGANKEGRNGVGIVVFEGLKDKVLEIFRKNDRIVKMRLSLDEEQIVVISAYAPQVGCRNEEKEEFWNALDEEMRNLEESEKVIIGGDLNGHIGGVMRGTEGYMAVMEWGR